MNMSGNAIWEHPFFSPDSAIFLLFNSAAAASPLDGFFPLITNGRFWIIPGLCLVISLFATRRWSILPFFILALITVGITDPFCVRILKPLAARLRPCHPVHFIEGGRFLLGYKKSFSFPSAHAMNIFAQAMLWSSFFPSRAVIFFLFALCIGLSRIYCGVHYPLDIFAGALFGVVVGYVIYFCFSILQKKRTA